MVKYDFKIEFYNYDDTNYIIASKPKLTIDTALSKAYIELTIGNNYGTESGMLYKAGSLKIYNVPQTFNENKQLNIKFHDAVKISYKKLAYSNEYHFLLNGLIHTPMDTDYLSRDFSVDYDITNSILNYKINSIFREPADPTSINSPLIKRNINFKGKSIGEAISTVFKGNEELHLPKNITNTKINRAFTCSSLNEFLTALARNYTIICKVEPQDKNNNIDSVYHFYYKTVPKEGGDSFLKPLALEKFGLHFIPQQELKYSTETRQQLVYWNAQVLYTHRIEVNTRVSFNDRFNNLITGVVEETSGSLSNRGACVLNLSIKDDKSTLASI
ncbi:hypothetical protein DB313_05590 (plasmid) [Borrelia turcica IST7]|uniref:Uncharacterized protein n=1 Tax=Borrelia turcica IST7 TaxID=1104446 RepID=A0A386PNE2_9SPIR|nr:DUF693 family protein [Borrelia turcica]AYE37011.1 hypothetical protein DB313_05590 [Borrelia turcica IST7]